MTFHTTVRISDSSLKKASACRKSHHLPSRYGVMLLCPCASQHNKDCKLGVSVVIIIRRIYVCRYQKNPFVNCGDER